MKTIFTILIMLTLSIRTLAQVTISLEQAEAYLSTPDGIPEDVSYLKDVNHILPKFVGVWKGTADDKTVELHLNQFLHLPLSADGFKIDQIAGRLLIKDQATGSVLYNTLNVTNNEDTDFKGYYPINVSYVMIFSNKNDINNCMDDGKVYISVNNTTLVNMTMNFYRTQEIMFEGQCPNFATYIPILPGTVHLVKQ